MSSVQKLASAICEFLSESIDDGSLASGSAEGIQVAISCIQEAFKIDDSCSIKPATLAKIFSVYEASQAKMSSQTPEQLKTLGNKAMADKNYVGAIQHYTSAIAIEKNAVFYANRAAAYSQNDQHVLAVEDAKSALEVDPSYSKAFSRMGHAYYCLGDYAEAVQAYEKGLALDPTNATMIQSLETAKLKAPDSGDSLAQRSTDQPSTSGGMPGMPAGMDFASMLQNPNLMQMAQSMMSNPAMAGMLNNPQIAEMAKSMMSDPNALASMMKNMGGPPQE